MIFRKPYGFLIKHFRLVHLIIVLILGYLVSYSTNIYSFLNNCIDDSVNRYNALEYINYGIYFFILLVIGLFFIIYWLFKYKDKPRIIYIISIVGYISIGIFMFVLFGYLGDLSFNVIDQKVIRAYRDIMLIVLLFQYLIIIIMFIRGLGFDIKKFNFNNDIHELDLKDEDGDEIEIEFKLDTDSILREVRRKKREFGYFFQEYKILILVILGIIIVILGFNIYNYCSDVFKVYKHGDLIGNINYITIKNSYYNMDNNEKNYVIVKFEIFKNGKKDKLNINNMILKVDKEEYFPNRNICYNFNKLGNCYKKQYITNDVNSYILVYEVKNLNSEKSYLLYREDYENTFKIKLELENYG